MTQPRDSQRSRLYKAERAGLWKLSKRYDSMEEMTSFVERVRGRKILQTWYPELRRRISVGDGRCRRSAGGDYHGIYMPRWSRFDAVILHEMSHTLTQRRHGYKVAAHGPEFCRIFLNLVGNVMGQEAARILKAGLKAHRVKVAPFGKD